MDLRTLAPQQLQSLNEQLESDIAALQDSMQTLSQAAMRFHKSGVALEELMKQEPGAELCVFFVNDTNFIDDLLFAGKKMLVPLTSSLYAPGTLGDSGRVLLDIGTGYFAEVSRLASPAAARPATMSTSRNPSPLSTQLTPFWSTVHPRGWKGLLQAEGCHPEGEY